MRRVDLAIVGGGPAGLAAAIEARQRGLEAVVLERHPGTIDKACGEGLMPAALAALDELGVERPAGHRLVGVSYCDAVDADLVAHGTFPHGPGLGARRTLLHANMRQRAIDLGCEIVEWSVRSVSQHAPFVRIDEAFEAQWVIAADGLHSRVRRELGMSAGRNPGTRFGLRRHFAIAPWSDRVEVYWSRIGEAYVTPIADDLVGVALLYDPPGRFADVMENFPVLRDRLRRAPAVTQARGAGAFGLRPDAVQNGRVLFVGDAAGYEDALTGEGIAIAITSAVAAVDAVAADQPEAYEARYRSQSRQWRWATRALLGMTRPRFVHGPLIRLLRASPAVFDGALGVLGGGAQSEQSDAPM